MERVFLKCDDYFGLDAFPSDKQAAFVIRRDGREAAFVWQQAKEPDCRHGNLRANLGPYELLAASDVG